MKLKTIYELPLSFYELKLFSDLWIKLLPTNIRLYTIAFDNLDDDVDALVYIAFSYVNSSTKLTLILNFCLSLIFFVNYAFQFF